MALITKDTPIMEAVQKWPETVAVFGQFDMGCIGCMAAHYETIGQGAIGHGVDPNLLVAALNDAIQK